MSCVTSEQVKAAIVSLAFHKLEKKTTVGIAVLQNGFEICESSSCVDPAKFDEKIGADLVTERIHHKVWELLGFQKQNENSPTPVKLDDEGAFSDD